jgi:hypothetical protein
MARGRPALDEAGLQARVDAYCRRYGTTREPSGLPPFPAGQRETAQHRQWLAIYRAQKRLLLRVAGAGSGADSGADSGSGSAGGVGAPASSSNCPVCARALQTERVSFAPKGSRSKPVNLHRQCAEVARVVESLGAAGAARLSNLLWAGRRR